MSTTKIKMLFYGTLRKNGKRVYNYQRFGGQEFLKTLKLNGYVMHNLGPYPAICLGDGEVEFELHDVELEAYSAIRKMEKYAGYSELRHLFEDGTSAILFVMEPAERLAGYPVIQSGVWE